MARDNRRAQRAARALARGARQTRQPPSQRLPKAVSGAGRRSSLSQGDRWVSGAETPTGKLERQQAARLASNSMHGKIDPKYYQALKKYFYHKENKQPTEQETEAEE